MLVEAVPISAERVVQAAGETKAQEEHQIQAAALVVIVLLLQGDLVL